MVYGGDFDFSDCDAVEPIYSSEQRTNGSLVSEIAISTTDTRLVTDVSLEKTIAEDNLFALLQVRGAGKTSSLFALAKKRYVLYFDMTTSTDDVEGTKSVATTAYV